MSSVRPTSKFCGVGAGQRAAEDGGWPGGEVWAVRVINVDTAAPAMHI